MSFNLSILIEYKNKDQFKKTSSLNELNKVSDYCFEIINYATKRKLAIQFHMRDLLKHQMVLNVTGSYIIGNAEDILADDYQGLSTLLFSRLTNLQEFINEIHRYDLISNLYLYLSDGDYLESDYIEKTCDLNDFSTTFTEIINRQTQFAYKVKFLLIDKVY